MEGPAGQSLRWNYEYYRREQNVLVKLFSDTIALDPQGHSVLTRWNGRIKVRMLENTI